MLLTISIPIPTDLFGSPSYRPQLEVFQCNSYLCASSSMLGSSRSFFSNVIEQKGSEVTPKPSDERSNVQIDSVIV